MQPDSRVAYANQSLLFRSLPVNFVNMNRAFTSRAVTTVEEF